MCSFQRCLAGSPSTRAKVKWPCRAAAKLLDPTKALNYTVAARYTSTRPIGLCKCAVEGKTVRLSTTVAILACVASRLHGQVDVLTAQYNLSRTSSNMRETVLTQSNVNSSQFGKLFSRTVDAPFYAFPLIVTDFEVPGVGLRNLVFIVTLGNTVYAFDADDPNAANPYWSVNLGPPQTESCCFPTVGILSTPVIDRSTKTMYLAAIVQPAAESNLFIYALDLATGALKYNSPQMIGYTFPSGITYTNAGTWIQRAGLLLFNNVLYVGTANVMENPLDWHTQEGFIQTFQADDLSVLMGTFETTPTGQGGGFWQAGRGIAADSSGNVFVAVDSGAYGPLVSFAVSVLKFSAGTVSPISWFTPSQWDFLYYQNLDLSANGVTLIPDTNLAFAGGKTGVIYLLDQTNLGGLGTKSEAAGGALQRFEASHGCGTTDCAQHLPTAYWPHPRDPYLFVWDVHDYLRAYPFNLVAERFAVKDATVGTLLPSRAGGMTITSNAAEDGTGIVWATTALEDPTSATVPGTLRAYDANDITQELYDSDQDATRDTMGSFVKMSTPVVANGKVYVNTQSNVLPVYGLLCQANAAPEVTITVGPLSRLSGSTYEQKVTFSNQGTEAIGGPFTLILSGLSAGAKLLGSSGTTSCVAPAGQVYRKLAKAPLWLKSGASFTADLEFTLNGATEITYTPILIAGSGGQ